MSPTAIITLVIIAAATLYVIGIYNRLVTLKNRYQNGFSQIEIQLKRRYDLIPNLVETAKAYLEHERGTLQSVTEARNSALSALKDAASQPGSPIKMEALASAEQVLSRSLGQFNLSVEAYPDLKANQTMAQLSEELTATENKVAFARQSYNDSVMGYNTYKQSFPPVVLASLFGHGDDASLLEFEDSAQIQAAPKVSF